MCCHDAHGVHPRPRLARLHEVEELGDLRLRQVEALPQLVRVAAGGQPSLDLRPRHERELRLPFRIDEPTAREGTFHVAHASAPIPRRAERVDLLLDCRARDVGLAAVDMLLQVAQGEIPHRERFPQRRGEVGEVNLRGVEGVLFERTAAKGFQVGVPQLGERGFLRRGSEGFRGGRLAAIEEELLDRDADQVPLEQPEQFLGLRLPDSGLSRTDFPDSEGVLLALVVEVDPVAVAAELQRGHSPLPFRDEQRDINATGSVLPNSYQASSVVLQVPGISLVVKLGN